MNEITEGQNVYVPCNCAEEFMDCTEALVRTQVISINDGYVTVDDKNGSETNQIELNKIHTNPSILILCLGDIRSESTNLDPLAKSVLHYCRLFHKDEGNVKYYKTRSLNGLKELWEEFGGLSKVIIFISHGCENGFTYGRNHKCSSAEELTELFKQDEEKEKKLFISLSCQTGSPEFGAKLSKSSFCREFIGPETNVHSALASQFCQTFLANYLMNGSDVTESFRKAKEAIPGTMTFNLFIDGQQHVTQFQPTTYQESIINVDCQGCGCFGEFNETQPEIGTVVQCSTCCNYYCHSCLNGNTICQNCLNSMVNTAI